MENKIGQIVGLSLMTLFGAMLWNPLNASAGFGNAMFSKSIHCDVTLASGGNPETDDYVTCAVNIKEISGYCVNKAGNAGTAKGKPFQLQAFTMASSSTGSWTKTQNGSEEQDIVITNQMIQLAFDIYNAKNGLPFSFLKTSSQKCPNGNWKWYGFFVSKADGQLVDSKVPSATDANGKTISGTAKYKTYDPTWVTPGIPSNDPSYIDKSDAHCRNVNLPNWDWTWDSDGENGTGTGTYTTTYIYTDCDFIGEPFNYCSRFPDQNGPDGHLADSGLRIYDTSLGLYTGTPGGEVSVIDGTYKIKNCYLFRDVNKDTHFDLSAFGTYDPDVANIITPQTGNVDGGDDNNLGGYVLRTVSTDPTVTNYYTGECHQHGKENSNGKTYSWDQQGPAKNVIDPTTGATVIRDAMCQGASQLMDGTYDDGILP